MLTKIMYLRKRSGLSTCSKCLNSLRKKKKIGKSSKSLRHNSHLRSVRVCMRLKVSDLDFRSVYLHTGRPAFTLSLFQVVRTEYSSIVTGTLFCRLRGLKGLKAPPRRARTQKKKTVHYTTTSYYIHIRS